MKDFMVMRLVNTNVDFIPDEDNPLKGGFGYPLKGGG